MPSFGDAKHLRLSPCQLRGPKSRERGKRNPSRQHSCPRFPVAERTRLCLRHPRVPFLAVLLMILPIGTFCGVEHNVTADATPAFARPMAAGFVRWSMDPLPCNRRML